MSHAFRSPYRCEDCDLRFWVVSRRTRITAAAVVAGMLTVALLVNGIVPIAGNIKPAGKSAAEILSAQGRIAAPASDPQASH